MDVMKTVKLCLVGGNISYSVTQSILLLVDFYDRNEIVDLSFLVYEFVIWICYIFVFFEVYCHNQSEFTGLYIATENLLHFIFGFVYSITIPINSITISVITFAACKFLITCITCGCLMSFVNRGPPLPKTKTLEQYAKTIPYKEDMEPCSICLDEFEGPTAPQIVKIGQLAQIGQIGQLASQIEQIDQGTGTGPIGQLGCGHYFHMVCLKSWKPTVLQCPMCSQPVENAKNYHSIV